jgi:Glycosyl transferase family 2
VLRQDYSDWEVIVSDNRSGDDVEGYVASLNEPRVKYFRTDRIVPVTENWNNALANSSGEYFLMLGDDDGLVNGYFRELERVLERFDEPDVVYSRAYQFAHAGVVPGYPTGYLQLTGVARFFRGRSAPFLLDEATARRVAGRALRFELAYDYNMQYATLSRRLIDSLGGARDFFRSAFPDYYAMNLIFLTARRIVVDPRPLTIIGISPKSYGFYHLSRREHEGLQMLGSLDGVDLGGAPLAGDDIKAGWLDAMRELERQLAGRGLRVDERRLRRLRAFEALLAVRRRELTAAHAVAHLRVPALPDQALVHAAAAAFFLSQPLPAPWRVPLRSRLLRHLPHWDEPMIDGTFESVVDVFEHRGELIWGTRQPVPE